MDIPGYLISRVSTALSLFMVMGSVIAADWGAAVRIGTNIDYTDWGAPWAISELYNPHATLNDAGAALAVWNEFSDINTPDHMNWFWTNKTDGSFWGSQEKPVYSYHFIEQLVSSPAGDALVLSNQPPHGRYSIPGTYTALNYSPVDGWSEHLLSTVDVIDSSRDDAVIMDHAGSAFYSQIYILFEEFYEVSVRRFEPDTGWGAKTVLSSTDIFYDDPVRMTDLKLAVSDTGVAFAVWLQESEAFSDHFDLWASRYEPGGGWSTAEMIENLSAPITGSPAIAVDGEGNAIATWGMAIPGNPDEVRIYGNRYQSGSWQDAGLIVWKALADSDIELVMDNPGNAWLLWSRIGIDGTRDEVKQYTSGSGWDINPFSLWGHQFGVVADDLQVVPVGKGKAIAAWTIDGGFLQSSYFDGDTWKRPATLGIAVLPDSNFYLAGNSGGIAYAVWLSSGDTAWASRFNTDSGWGGSVRLDSNTGVEDTPKIAINSLGDAVTIWTENAGESVWTNLFETANTVVDFESTPAGDYASITTRGYDFSPVWNTVVMVYDDGLTRSISPRWNDTMQLQRSDGQPFELSSFSYQGRWDCVSSTVEITGTRSDGSTVRTQFDYDASGWKSRNLNWKDLVHVGFYTPGGRLQMDNFVLVDPAATVFDFEARAAGDYEVLTIDEFNFTPLWNTLISIYNDGDNQSISPVWNDTLRLSRNDGSSFDLTDFDYNGRWQNVTGDLQVIGLRTDGSQIMDSFSFTLGDWQSRSVNWTGLIQVDFISSNGRVLLDNIALH